MLSDSTVEDLVARAHEGDQAAWDEIVERYAPLVWSICRKRFRLDPRDTADVGQTVWLRLVGRLGALREPAALPGWLATTTYRECLRVLWESSKQEDLERSLDMAMRTGEPAAHIEQAVLKAEQDAALRAALERLSPQCRRLLGLLMQDSGLSYAEIADLMDMQVGGIGPTRARCLAKLRETPPLAALLDSGETGSRHV